jgi:hypothetical protein
MVHCDRLSLERSWEKICFLCLSFLTYETAGIKTCGSACLCRVKYLLGTRKLRTEVSEKALYLLSVLQHFYYRV